MEFHISRSVRERLGVDDALFGFSGNVVFANVTAARKLAQRMTDAASGEGAAKVPVNAGALFAMGLIDELSHALVARYRREKDPAVMAEALRWLQKSSSPAEAERLLLEFASQFPTVAVYRGEQSAAEWLEGTTEGVPNREVAFEEMLLLWLANGNPAFQPFRALFADEQLKQQTVYGGVTAKLGTYFETRPPVGPKLGTLLEALRAPMLASPDSLTGQLDVIGEIWAEHLDDDLRKVLLAIDVLREEELATWMRFHPAGADNHRHGAPGRGGEGFVGDEFIGFESEFVTGPDGVRRRRYAVDYQAPLNEYEAFSADQAWMPTVVLMAKSTYVWLEQLSKKYQRHIQRLDEIPDEELQLLAARGISGLWLIGLWERSRASKTIKRLRGNADAVASAYSLKDYRIADDLGGEQAYENLRHRAGQAGLRLASDMVPNHMGIDSDWVIDHPEWFLSRWESPFPSYGFEGPDLSTDSRVEIKIEDHYYDQTDAAVVFRLRHHRDGSTRYMYHGNDGTTFAWNDTAQLDYSKADVREHVIQVILNVARRFPIIRFDAAMVLAKRHVQRLWFPLPGAGGSIPSRAENALSEEAFDALMPHEFWREVVDRVAVEVPGTLLLAEAFWLLEGYFVRTLGMHRVYNSAFMNMLRDEENAKYRSYLKKTVEFDPDILKRYVNFMSNPDERTATDQFGSGDKYFGVSVLLATLPGLPMFGHGQIEGFTERYGMDFKQARMDETPDGGLIARHQQLIAPLLKNRQLFAESTNFVMYDFWTGYGDVDENVFAYSNRNGDQRGLILYNNRYGSTQGTIKISVAFLEKHSGALRQVSVTEGLNLPYDGGAILAYRDTVQGLEYLRRASEVRDNGFRFELRGYQHAVLLEWRELRSSESQPWDRLCDALHGSGVYSVDEALSQLRLQPLVHTLHGVINSTTVAAFAKAAEAQSAQEPETAVPKTVTEMSGTAATPKAPAQPPAALLNKAMQKTEAVSRVDEPVPATAASDKEKTAEDAALLQEFAASVQRFAQTALSLQEGGTELEPGAEERTAKLGLAALHLPQSVAAFPPSLQAAAKVMLPSSDAPAAVHASAWAPVVAWIALQTLPKQSAVAIYDSLRLRNGLAESFSLVGLQGEQAWRAAAQVRVLLAGQPAQDDSPAETPALWSDGDVRWLTGVHLDAAGTERFEQHGLERFVCWLQLPKLLGEDTAAGQAAISEATRLAELAKQSAYGVEAFLLALAGQAVAEPSQPAPAKAGQAQPAAVSDV